MLLLHWLAMNSGRMNADDVFVDERIFFWA